MKKILIISLLLLSTWMSAGAVDLNKENRDPKYVESIVNRSQKIVDKLGLTDKQVAEDVRNIIANRYFELNDIYEIRSVMEGLCAKWAAKKATPEQIEELEEIVYLTEFHVSKGHSGQVFELDNKFHETLYQASGSKVLAGVLTDFHNYVQRVRKMTLKSKERSEKSNDEHRMIAQAIHDHDPEKAQMLANQHIMRTIENIDHCGWDNLLQESSVENQKNGK